METLAKATKDKGQDKEVKREEETHVDTKEEKSPGHKGGKRKREEEEKERKEDVGGQAKVEVKKEEAMPAAFNAPSDPPVAKRTKVERCQHCRQDLHGEKIV